MNTIENKTKFFAQYWGNDCYAKDINIGYRTLKVGDVLWKHYIKENYETSLLLKPLSSISDEDVWEIVKIMYYKPNKENYIISRIEKEGKKWVRIHTSNYNFSKNTGSIHFNIGFERTYISFGTVHNTVKITDFLRSRGYALDWNGITVEHQLEYGWIKYKKLAE